MEIVSGLAALLVIGVVARFLHERAKPPAQVHSAARNAAEHDPKEIAGSGSEGQGIG